MQERDELGDDLICVAMPQVHDPPIFPQCLRHCTILSNGVFEQCREPLAKWLFAEPCAIPEGGLPAVANGHHCCGGEKFPVIVVAWQVGAYPRSVEVFPCRPKPA